MKLTSMRSAFLDGLQTVQNVVSSKGVLQILSNALLQAKDGKLSITTTDLDIAERCEVECEVEREGSTTLPVRRLVGMIRELPEGKVLVEVNDPDEATVQSGSSFYKIIGLPKIRELEERFLTTCEIEKKYGSKEQLEAEKVLGH